jgi:hypothetical protein
MFMGMKCKVSSCLPEKKFRGALCIVRPTVWGITRIYVPPEAVHEFWVRMLRFSKSISTNAQYVTLLNNFSHPSFFQPHP